MIVSVFSQAEIDAITTTIPPIANNIVRTKFFTSIILFIYNLP